MAPLMAAIAGLHCWSAIAGCGLDVVPLLAAITGDKGRWVYKLADWIW